MINANAMLVESVRKGTTLCTNSSTNFFEFIEVFKNLQNIVMGNEKRYVPIFIRNYVAYNALFLETKQKMISF